MFKMIYNIARTELQMLFYSPVAWLILVVFGVQSGMLFADQLAQLVSSQEMGYNVSCERNQLDARSQFFFIRQW